MASTNKTTNLKLSQYIASDKPTWLNDYNNDMQTIDTALDKSEKSIERSAKLDTKNTFTDTQTFSKSPILNQGINFDNNGDTMKIAKYGNSLFSFRFGETLNAGAYLGYRENQWSFSPLASSGLHLGHPSYKWCNIFAENGVIQTSDATMKKNIENLDDSFVIAMVENLRPVQYQMKNGESGRTHIGFIAQEVENVLGEVGKTSMDFAGFIKSPKTEEYTELDLEGNKITKTREVDDEFIYGLRYEEFIALICRYTQIKSAQQDVLAKELNELKTTVAELVKNK